MSELLVHEAPGRGRVSEFDSEVGLGRVTTPDGRSFGFHCAQIADGSRNIEVGTPVAFQVVPGHLGSWEAVRITPVEL
ncbi:MAG: hypothetical protein ACRD0I_10755 [Acidimicrobiales bacterium]